ncbi:MAG: DUF402 domain-containing protein [Candidatus Bathyarchaeia archaeon]
MTSASVRGIYATGVTKLLMDAGFTIVHPSEEIRNRFNVPEATNATPDVTIRDRPDRQGFKAEGKEQTLEAISHVIRGSLDHTVIRRSLRGDEATPATFDFEFSLTAKQQLDEIRSQVLPTVGNHHFLKSCGGALAAAVDMAERLLASGKEREEVENLAARMLNLALPTEDSSVPIHHVKLDGTIIPLGVAVIQEFDEENRKLVWRRTMLSPGRYDGLGTLRKPGDHAVSETGVGEWFVKTTYYSPKGECKGTYVNINTPVELYPEGIRYIDLELDCCIYPDGKTRTLDREKLQEAERVGVISHATLQKAEETMQTLMDNPLLVKEMKTLNNPP